MSGMIGKMKKASLYLTGLLLKSPVLQIKRLPVLVLLVIVLPFFSEAQQSISDSLSQQLKLAKQDTIRVKLLFQLSENAPNDSGILSYALQALNLAKKINYKKGMADALNNIGYVYANRGNNAEAIKLHEQSLSIQEDIGDKEGVAITLNNIAYIYHNIGDIPKALNYNERSLKIREEIGDEKGIAYSLNNIGNIFLDQLDFEKALEYFLRSLKISENLGESHETALALSNIGSVYDHLGEDNKAIESYEKCLKISQQMSWKKGIATALNNLGSINKRNKNLNQAFEYYEMSLKLYRELGDKLLEVSVLNNLSSCYFEANNFKEALSFGNLALHLANDLGYPASLRDVSFLQSKINAASGNYKRAYELQILHKQMADSVNNESTREATVKNQMQYEFDKVQATLKADQEKKDAINNAAIQKQKIVRNGLIAGFAVLLFFSIIVYHQRNDISKAKGRSDELLLNILPGETAEELKLTGRSTPKKFEQVTVLFTDFKDFTTISANLSAEELVNEINFCYSSFDEIITKHGIEKIKTIGDSYMCAGGLPVENLTHARDILVAAIEIRDFMLQEKIRRESLSKPGFEIRIGINTGPVVAGIVGVKKFAFDIWGDTVNIASRMESASEPGKINISGSTYNLVKDKFKCTYRGKINAKNKGEIEMYFVEGVLS